MSALDDVKPGDVLIVRDVNEHRLGGPQKAIVGKVGPKRLTIAVDGRDRFVSKEDGRISDWRWVQTTEAYEAEREMAVLRSRVRELGWDVRSGHKATIAEVRAVIAALGVVSPEVQP